MKKLIRSLANKVGIDVVRYPHPTPFNFFTYVLGKIDIGLILDVGANIGQFGEWIRAKGWHGPMVSFEPIEEMYSQLCHQIANDPLWEAHNFALGDKDEEKLFNISGHSQSSSFLEVKPERTSLDQSIKTIDTTKVIVKTLETVTKSDLIDQSKRWLLKLDVQGYEPNVIQGAIPVMDNIHAILCELTVTPAYSGQKDMHEMWDIFRDLGFSLYHIMDGWRNPNDGDMLEFDGLFIRKEHNSLF